MNDHSGDHRWLSYSQLAEARDISRASAIRLVRKHRWRRQKDNQGTVTVAVPVAFTVTDRKGPGDAPGGGPGDRPSALAALSAALETLKGELVRAHARADAAETATGEARAEAQEAREAVEALRVRITVLEGELTAERAKAAEEKGNETYRLEEIKSRISIFGSLFVGLFITGTLVPALLVIGRGEGITSRWQFVSVAVPYAMAAGCAWRRYQALEELKTHRPLRRGLLSRWRDRGRRVTR